MHLVLGTLNENHSCFLRTLSVIQLLIFAKFFYPAKFFKSIQNLIASIEWWKHQKLTIKKYTLTLSWKELREFFFLNIEPIRDLKKFRIARKAQMFARQIKMWNWKTDLLTTVCFIWTIHTFRMTAAVKPSCYTLSIITTKLVLTK